jgi:hypothetical protein
MRVLLIRQLLMRSCVADNNSVIVNPLRDGSRAAPFVNEASAGGDRANNAIPLIGAKPLARLARLGIRLEPMIIEAWREDVNQNRAAGRL